MLLSTPICLMLINKLLIRKGWMEVTRRSKQSIYIRRWPNNKNRAMLRNTDVRLGVISRKKLNNIETVILIIFNMYIISLTYLLWTSI